MAILSFSEITEEHSYLGGKAQNLGRLSNAGFPVPVGIVLTSVPSEDEWQEINAWWLKKRQTPLAVRSSASDEDNAEVSFAGQNSSFLDIKEVHDLKKAILACFESINKSSSQAYRKHFLGQVDQGSMNVVIQEMVTPLYAGVYFSMDPRGAYEGDLIEFVEGLGEALVSGQTTPYKIINGQDEKTPSDWKNTYTIELQKMGKEIKEFLQKEIDVEWAIDQSGQLKLLQARPITATFAHSNRIKITQKELDYIDQNFSADITWDGQTFSEWTGLPSFLTYSLFEKTFATGGAFDQALKELGYESFNSTIKTNKDSVLDRIMGRAYLNLNRMSPLYFGDIPFSIKATPRPHLKFDFAKLNFKTLINLPAALFNMIKVGFNLSTKRRYWLGLCHEKLNQFRTKMNRPIKPDLYQDWSDEDLLNRFSKEVHVFTQYHQIWPLVLIILTESTMQSLRAIVKNVLGENKADQMISHWMSIGLKTASFDMNNYFRRSCIEPKKREFFMNRYGHRAAGELDLINPRWIELNPDDFFSTNNTDYQLKPKEEIVKTVEDEINELKTFKKTIILQEWRFLKEMLELREAWKMAILKPFAQIRFITQELAKRSLLGKDIYSLSYEEIIQNKIVRPENITTEIRNLIKKRQDEESIFKLYSFPNIVTIQKLKAIVKGEIKDDQTSLDGESLSPGIIFGKVKVVTDINQVKLNTIEPNTIIVADSTDPGWTPLFAKASGIVVAKGGVLSHSAIVAREMGIPAISGINNATLRFKDGDQIWLDANNGHITYEHRS